MAAHLCGPLSKNSRVHAKSLQSCLTPCDPMDCSPPGSSVHGILQARILEWVAMPSSRHSAPGTESASSVSCIGRRILYHYSHRRSPPPQIYKPSLIMRKTEKPQEILYRIPDENIWNLLRLQKARKIYRKRVNFKVYCYKWNKAMADIK